MIREKGNGWNGQQSGSHRADRNNGEESKIRQFQGRGKCQFCNGDQAAGRLRGKGKRAR